MRPADHAQHGKPDQSGAGNEYPLRIRACVRRVHEESFRHHLRQVILHHAFQDVFVPELQAHPQSFGPRPTGERLPGHRFRIAKLAHEVDAFDVFQLDPNRVAACVQQFDLAIGDEIGCNVAVQRIAV